MILSNRPTALLSHLHHTDGSATYFHNGCTVICAVNGPIEVPRRDEHPEEATIDVVVQPAIGVGGPGERLLESMLLKTLRHIIIRQNYPRSLIQVSLQVCTMPGMTSQDVSDSKFSPNILILPALIQASVLGLLTAAIPLSTTVTAAMVVSDESGRLIQDPSPDDMEKAVSIHVMAFDSEERLILAESRGSLEFTEWTAAFQLCKGICRAAGREADMETEEVQTNSMQAFIRDEMEKHTRRDMQWKEELQ